MYLAAIAEWESLIWISSSINHLTREILIELKEIFKSSASSLRQLASPSPLVGAGDGVYCVEMSHTISDVNSRYSDGVGGLKDII